MWLVTGVRFNGNEISHITGWTTPQVQGSPSWGLRVLMELHYKNKYILDYLLST